MPAALSFRRLEPKGRNTSQRAGASPMVRRYRPGFDLRPPLPRRACPISFFPVDTGKTRMRRNPYHCPTLWILACGDVVFPAKAGNHVTPVREALASSHHPLSDRRRLPQRGRPLPNLPPSGGGRDTGVREGRPTPPPPPTVAPPSSHHPLSDRRRLPQRGRSLPNLPPSGGKGHGGSGRASQATPATNRHSGSNLSVIRQRLLRLSGESRKPRAPAAIALLSPGGNQTSLKNHPNQTNHSSRPRRYLGMCGMGVTNLSSHPWAGGNLLSLRVWGYVDSGFRRKDGGDGGMSEG